MFKYRTIAIIILVIFGGFILSKSRIFGSIRNFGIVFASPLSSSFGQATLKSSGFFQTLFSISKLKSENEELLEENTKLKSENLKLKEVEYENKILSEQLGFFKEQKELKLTPAKIILRSPTDFSRYLTINKGSDDGISEGAAVLSSGFMIGRVSQVFKNTSQFFTLTDISSSVPVIFQESRATGLLKGSLKGLVVENVPLDIQVKEGEAVLTFGLGNEVPTDLPIGKVDKIVSKEGEIFQKVAVSSPISFSKVEIVFVAGSK